MKILRHITESGLQLNNEKSRNRDKQTDSSKSIRNSWVYCFSSSDLAFFLALSSLSLIRKTWLFGMKPSQNPPILRNCYMTLEPKWGYQLAWVFNFSPMWAGIWTIKTNSFFSQCEWLTLFLSSKIRIVAMKKLMTRHFTRQDGLLPYWWYLIQGTIFVTGILKLKL